MDIKGNTLMLNSHDLKNILVHVVLCAECLSEIGKNINTMDLVSEFKNELDNQKWLNGLESMSHTNIEISL